jgi:hypothetical protein
MRNPFKRPPDFVIGPKETPYLRRWWILPRNRFFNIYLHNILRDDDDSALHDHPWHNVSIVLSGGYWEYTPSDMCWRAAGSITFRKATQAHRLALKWDDSTPHGKPTWTLFITGPVIREWGFHCPKGWRHWRDFVDERDTGAIGRGCGEHE